MRDSRTGRFAAWMLAAAMLCAPLAPGSAQAADDSASTGSDFVTGLGCLLVAPVYGAAKLAFAISGGLVGGLAWAFSGGNIETADSVWDPTLKGTYVITPDHLTGRKPIEFIGS